MTSRTLYPFALVQPHNLQAAGDVCLPQDAKVWSLIRQEASGCLRFILANSLQGELAPHDGSFVEHFSALVLAVGRPATPRRAIFVVYPPRGVGIAAGEL